MGLPSPPKLIKLLCVHAESLAARAAQAAFRASELAQGREITRMDVQAARQRLLAARRQAQRQCFAVARQFEDSARVHLEVETMHRRAVALGVADGHAHAEGRC